MFNARSAVAIGSLICMTLAMVACGGGGSGDDEPGPDTGPLTNPPLTTGDIPTLSPRSTIAIDASSQVIGTALNADGSEVAVLTQDTPDALIDFSSNHTISIYDTSTGVALRVLADIVETAQPLDMYWSGNEITVDFFGGSIASWDAPTGAFLESIAPLASGDCNVTSPISAFDSVRNRLYAIAAFGAPELCVFDFVANTITLYSLNPEAPSTRVASMVLDPSGENLWITFETSELIVSGTRVYDATSITPVGGLRPEARGEIVAVGDGFQLYNDSSDFILNPGEIKLDDFPSSESVSADGRVLALNAGDTTRLIALPAAVYIGTLPRDFDERRSFSADSQLGAFKLFDENLIEIHELTGRSLVSAVAAEVVFDSVLSGTILVDGLLQMLSGTCDLIIEPEVGPNIINMEATTDSGETFRARAQNLLGFTSFSLTQGDLQHVAGTTLAQIYAQQAPTVTVSGNSIDVTGKLYRFTTDLFIPELITDAADPTGFETLDFELSAQCI